MVKLSQTNAGQIAQRSEDGRTRPPGAFESSSCPNATLDDLNDDLVVSFAALARRVRNVPLSDKPIEILEQLSLLKDGCPTNAAVLLFGRKPQRFLRSSVVQCAHFQGIDHSKPVKPKQAFKGTLFDLVDQSVDFVVSKINQTTQLAAMGMPARYPIPSDVIREAIVNAVAHRDYASEDRVQVLLFADRLEVRNPGSLAPSLTIDMLRRPHDSYPRNPLVAKCLYLAKYTERIGTGTRDMIMTCRGVGLPVPLFTLKEGFVATFGRIRQQD